MREPTVYCDECGRPKNKRWISLSTQMTSGLAFCAGYRPNPMPLFDLGQAFGGTGSAVYQAFHNLRYFNLAEWFEGKTKSGLWIPTAQGLWFLEGLHEVPRRVRVYNNQVIERDPLLIGIEAVPYVKVDIDYARTQMAPATDEDVARAKYERDHPIPEEKEDDESDQ